MSLIKVKIDGTEVEVPPGTTILKAAEQAGVEIPTFCYHDALTRPANCRMCLVNTNKAPKLLPACYSTVMDGMEVTTTDPKTEKTRKSTLEFILLHHPVDCPICDQAGECTLQNHYFDHSASKSRSFTRKNHKPKAVEIGPRVTFDAERCIVCTRCVRFCDEVSKSGELQVVQRGERSEISTFPGRSLDNAYSLNTVDLCPVGALTSTDFRFKMRVWFLNSANSVCSGCARGCNIIVDHGENRVQRYRPRYNADVNQFWMCDAGRETYQEFQQQRLDSGRVSGFEVPTKDALSAAAAAIDAFVKERSVDALAFVLSPLSTNEDTWGVLALAEALGVTRFYVGGRAAGQADELLVLADKNPNRKGLETLLAARGLTAEPLSALTTGIASGAVGGVVWVGHEHPRNAPLEAALQKLALRVVLTSNASVWSTGASVIVATRTFEESDGTWTNAAGKTQRLFRALEPLREIPPTWDAAARIGRALSAALPLWLSARSVFDELVRAAPTLATTWDGPSGRKQGRPDVPNPGFRAQAFPRRG